MLTCHRPLGVKLLFQAAHDICAHLTHHVQSAVRMGSDVSLAAQILERGPELSLGKEVVLHMEDVGGIGFKPPVRWLAAVVDADLIDRTGRVVALQRPHVICIFPAIVELALLVPLVHRVIVIHPAGGSGENRGLAEVGGRAAEHMRVPCKIDVV